MSTNSDNSNVEPSKKTPRFLRKKKSELDQVLPPVSELVGDKPVLRYVDLDGDEQTLDYQNLTGQDSMPIPMPADREGYGSIEKSDRYWASGHTDWLNVNEAIKRYAPVAEKTNERLRLLDFGCATGRFLRHAWTFGKEKVDAWGCDFAPANINWAKKHLPSELKILLNTEIPHLPFPDEYFDVTTAFSVFTHIDIFEEAWLLELRRITKPNGLLFLTIQNEATWDRLPKRPNRIKKMLGAHDVSGIEELSEQLLNGPMPNDRIVLHMTKRDVYNRDVWSSSAYVHENWSRFFEILNIADNAHFGFQTPVIMRPA